MKKYLLLFLPLLVVQFAVADDQVRNVQTELKTQGFYYGDLNGQETAETSAALRRFQIRKGLSVTGTLNEETLRALGMKGDAPTPGTERPAPVTRGPDPSRRQSVPPSAAESDRNFLREEESRPSRVPAPEREEEAPPSPPRASSAPPESRPQPTPDAPPSPLASTQRPSAVALDYAEFFASTPYANLHAGVQRELARRAQVVLSRRGFFHEAADGVPSPALEEAILRFQRHDRLPTSGRLDMLTVASLNLLPKYGPDPAHWRGLSPSNPAERREAAPDDADRENGPRRIYRGVQVD